MSSSHEHHDANVNGVHTRTSFTTTDRRHPLKSKIPAYVTIAQNLQVSAAIATLISDIGRNISIIETNMPVGSSIRTPPTDIFDLIDSLSHLRGMTRLSLSNVLRHLKVSVETYASQFKESPLIESYLQRDIAAVETCRVHVSTLIQTWPMHHMMQ